MPTLKFTVGGIRYDFCLHYNRTPAPFTVGEYLKSPLRDDTGRHIFFHGTGYVVATSTSNAPAPQSAVYFTVHAPIE